MESNDCSTIYRFQFASIALLCTIYLPFTFHSNIWSIYIQPFTPINCTTYQTPLLFNYSNQTDCCPCNDQRYWPICQEWFGSSSQDIEIRYETIVNEVSFCCCGRELKSRIELSMFSGI